MTNLEANKDKLDSRNSLCVNAHICRYGKSCEGKKCEYCEFYGDSAEESIKAMLAEYKEPIKLKKWEYDLLKVYQKFKDDGEFSDHFILIEMQYKGHFQDVDYNLTIEEILDNCEVIEK